jgi:hypothetical protein
MSTMVTVSPLVPVAKYQQIARTRIARDGVAAFGAMTADFRQRAHLRRLAERLGAEPGLRVSFVARTDGVTQMAAMPAGQRHAGWFGDVMGVPESDEDPFW